MRRRANSGFTIVEVIVTAVIVAVLAGVAIPNYIGYVNQTRQDAVASFTETAATAVNSYWRKTKTTDNTKLVAEANKVYGADQYDVTINTTSGMLTATHKTNSLSKSISYK